MDTREEICCYNNTHDKCQRKKNCLGIVATILLASFAVVIGIILGAVFSTAILAALSAVIVLAVVLGLLLILTIILMVCNKRKDRK